MFKHILVPTDGSDLSQKAIDGAIDLAQSVGVLITAYTCRNIRIPLSPMSPSSRPTTFTPALSAKPANICVPSSARRKAPASPAPASRAWPPRRTSASSMQRSSTAAMSS